MCIVEINVSIKVKRGSVVSFGKGGGEGQKPTSGSGEVGPQ